MARAFLQPQNSTHRQHQALRAYFVEALPSAEAARRGGYTPGSFRVLVHQFRQTGRPGEEIVCQQNLSIYDISQVLSREAGPLSPVAVSLILREEGFARLPRRQDEERPPAPPWPMSPIWTASSNKLVFRAAGWFRRRTPQPRHELRLR